MMNANRRSKKQAQYPTVFGQVIVRRRNEEVGHGKHSMTATQMNPEISLREKVRQTKRKYPRMKGHHQCDRQKLDHREKQRNARTRTPRMGMQSLKLSTPVLLLHYF